MCKIWDGLTNKKGSLMWYILVKHRMVHLFCQCLKIINSSDTVNLIQIQKSAQQMFGQISCQHCNLSLIQWQCNVTICPHSSKQLQSWQILICLTFVEENNSCKWKALNTHRHSIVKNVCSCQLQMTINKYKNKSWADNFQTKVDL